MYSFIKKWSLSTCSGPGKATSFEDIRMNKTSTVMELTGIQTNWQSVLGATWRKGKDSMDEHRKSSNPDVLEEVRSKLRF